MSQHSRGRGSSGWRNGPVKSERSTASPPRTIRHSTIPRFISPGASGASRDDLAPASRHDSGPAGVAGPISRSLPPLASNRRPLTEYGSAQRLLGLFTPAPGTELQASDWEQGPSSTEELRKADPALLTPIRPLGGVGLGIGRSTSGHRPGGSRGDWRRHGSDDRSAAHRGSDRGAFVPGRHSRIACAHRGYRCS